MSEKDLAKAISETIKLDNLTTLSADDSGGKPPVTRLIDKNKVSNKLVTYHKPRSIESEYFRFLKAKLEHYFDDHPADKEKGRVILVTGATVGSGKTTCALNIALSFARAYGNRVLFLDADSRRPASQTYLGFGKKILPGLSDVLTLRQRAGNVLINTGLANLVYFPSGDFSEKLIDRLRSEELAILMDSLRKRFRYVIIDAPPAFPMPEPGILAKYCDGVLIVLGAGKDGHDQLDQAMEVMNGSPILGVILNKVRSTPGRKYGGYGYYGKSEK